MEIKGFCNDLSIDEVECQLEDQYECARREPTTVNVYLVSTSETSVGICKHAHAVNTFCVFSKEQAIRTAKEQYIKWRNYNGYSPHSKFITSMKVSVKFGTNPAKHKTWWLHSK